MYVKEDVSFARSERLQVDGVFTVGGARRGAGLNFVPACDA